MKLIKTSVLCSLSLSTFVFLNQANGFDPTRGVLQNNSALCGYGYNPNCGGQQHTETSGSSAHFEPTIHETCQTQTNGTTVCEYRYISTGLRFMTHIYDTQGQKTQVISYHNDGITPSLITPYKNGKEHGTSQYFDQQGKVYSSVQFVNGVKHGEQTFANEAAIHFIHGHQLFIGLALNAKTGDYGLTYVSGFGDKDANVARTVALSSCIAKEQGKRLSTLPSKRMLKAHLALVQNDKTACKIADLSYVGYSPMSIALFRAKRADGSFNFYGAYGKETVNQNDHRTQYADCKHESADCTLLVIHNAGDVVSKLKNHTYIE